LLLTKFVISDFRRDVEETRALLGYYAASCGNFLQTFRENISAQSSGISNKKKKRNINPEERISYQQH